MVNLLKILTRPLSTKYLSIYTFRNFVYLMRIYVANVLCDTTQPPHLVLFYYYFLILRILPLLQIYRVSYTTKEEEIKYRIKEQIEKRKKGTKG